ncbi:hypothetical protein J4205_02260 [Candidatus Pacearchaeota archaeon]|nr:hypothetical protein [Candidatus Pacearchaeota archaeon]
MKGGLIKNNMRFNIRKIASVLASAAMIGSTIGIAAAASFPAPFVSGSNADVAIVVGSSAANTDYLAAVDLGQSLQSSLSGTGGSSDTVSGEAYELWTSSTKIYLNDSINKARTSITDSYLPNALKEGSFQGVVTATYTQKIDLGFDAGSNNRLVYGQHPTSDDDPIYAFDLGTTSGLAVYNLSISFNKAVNFTNSDSEGQVITLFGTEYTVGSETDNTNIILLGSSIKVDLDSVSNPSTEVTVAGKTYTVELVSASDSAATVKVTDSDGNSDSKEITEKTSKTIKGVEVAVNTADETNSKLSATVLIGTNKIKLTDSAAVKVGSDETTIDGTNVRFGDNGANTPHNITKITFQIAADDTDIDAAVSGGEFVDPVFGSIKLSFPGLSIAADSTSREDIKISNSGSDKMTVNFQDWASTEAKSVEWYYNKTTSVRADGLTAIGFANLADSSGDAINIFEREQINKSEYVVVGNQDTGGIWEFISLTNDTASATASEIKLRNRITGKEVTAKSTNWGTGTIDLDTQSYTFDFEDNKNVEGDENIRLRYQDGSKTTTDNAVAFPTIQTAKGAKLMFYEPLVVNLSDWDGVTVGGGPNAANISVIKVPDGDGYTNIAVVPHKTAAFTAGYSNFTVTVGSGSATDLITNTSSSADGAIGQLTWNLTSNGHVGANAGLPGSPNFTAVLRLEDVAGAVINTPAIVIFEEKDDSTSKVYEALIVKIEGAGTTAASLGVTDVETTWGKDAQFDDIQMKTDNDLYKSADFWGSLITLDQSDTDSYSATISYPDEQVYAKLYIAENSAAITAGGSGGGSGGSLGSVTVRDSEVASVSSKNLIVLGGSCVNTVAATLLGNSSPLCGADFTTKTGVGSGEYLVETFASPQSASKIATLVAGYNAADTTNAVKFLTTKNPLTESGKKYKGTTTTDGAVVA